MLWWERNTLRERLGRRAWIGRPAAVLGHRRWLLLICELRARAGHRRRRSQHLMATPIPGVVSAVRRAAVRRNQRGCRSSRRPPRRRTAGRGSLTAGGRGRLFVGPIVGAGQIAPTLS